MLIFDFDGVLINSLHEVTLTAYNAATGKRFASLAGLPAALIGLFQHNRFHVQPIGDAIILMNWCLHNFRTAPDQILKSNEYEALIADAAVSTTDRTLRIYETRSQFIAGDPESWLALHCPYQPLWDELIQRSNSVFVILTNKNRDATLRLCEHFGLNIHTADVYSGDGGRSKVENMRQIHKRYTDQPFGIIDDSVKNLRELEKSFDADIQKIRLFLASWGYTGPGDERIAQEYGYPVLCQKDVVTLLGKGHPRKNTGPEIRPLPQRDLKY